MRVPTSPAKLSVPLALILVFTHLVACSGGEAAQPGGGAVLSTTTTATGPAATPETRDRDRGRGGGHGHGHGSALTVMTRNLYLGADLGPVIAAADPQAFVAATTAVWSMVNANAFTLRVEAIAGEIASERPALVGLQEAYVWTIQDPPSTPGGPPPAPRVVFDYVASLVDALAARGLAYAPVAQVDLFRFAAPIATGQTVALADHGVILARGDVRTSNPTATVFPTLLQLPVMGQPVTVQRGWVSVDVQPRPPAHARGRGAPGAVRFVSTHLEAFHPLVRTAQAGELAAALAGETRPVILVGDLNSLPGTEGAAVLAGAGFTDAWAALRPDAPGFTCCFPVDLSLDGTLDERIDYVLLRGPLAAREVEIVGDEAEDRVSGLWPSDHAGLVGELRWTGSRSGR